LLCSIYASHLSATKNMQCTVNLANAQIKASYHGHGRRLHNAFDGANVIDTALVTVSK
jgi:hypothetical protein